MCHHTWFLNSGDLNSIETRALFLFGKHSTIWVISIAPRLYINHIFVHFVHYHILDACIAKRKETEIFIKRKHRLRLITLLTVGMYPEKSIFSMAWLTQVTSLEQRAATAATRHTTPGPQNIFFVSFPNTVLVNLLDGKNSSINSVWGLVSESYTESKKC